MKPLLAVLIFVLNCQFVTAQVQKGDKILSLTAAAFPTRAMQDQDDVGLILKVNAEFIVGRRWSFATQGFYSNNTTFVNEGGTSLNAVGVIPTVQYYLVNKATWQFYVNGGYGFGFTDRTLGSAQNGALTIITAGIAGRYKIGKRLHLALEIPYFRANNITIDFEEAEGPLPFIGLSYQF
jgi:hypothetical protein